MRRFFSKEELFHQVCTPKHFRFDFYFPEYRLAVEVDGESDDQLTQSDHERLKWLRGLLKKLAATTQIIVFTCRPSDYLLPEELAQTAASAGDSYVRSIDLLEVIGTTTKTKSART